MFGPNNQTTLKPSARKVVWSFTLSRGARARLDTLLNNSKSKDGTGK
jgi:hypothetical protein